MSIAQFTESEVESVALAWLESLGWSVRHGLDVAPGEAGAERANYAQVLLDTRLRNVLARLNPTLPRAVLEDAFSKLTCPDIQEATA